MTDAELDELESEAKILIVKSPTIIISLITELRQAWKERDWLTYQLEKNLACYPPNDNDCSVCNRLNCTYTSHTSWLKAAQEATCQKS